MELERAISDTPQKINISNDVLIHVYLSLIRPIFEYASAAFHPNLTSEHSEELERLQQISLKVIFSLETSYQTCLDLSGLERLDVRREALFRNFVVKTYDSPRFYDRWYVPQQSSGYSLRKERRVNEYFALRDRLLNAPLYKARKMINDGL